MQAANGGTEQQTREAIALRYILEGTAGETGPQFFDALVKYLAQALGVAGAWVTQWVDGRKRLRALSFYFEGGYIPDFEYDVRGTPCERVMEEARLIHFPACVVELFPDDRDLRNCRAVGYVGIPLFDVDGTILGNLAALHTAKLPLDATIESLFRIFAARATAEVRRLRAEADLRDREQRLSLLVATALDAIIELDGNLGVVNANPSAGAAFGCQPAHMIGESFGRWLNADGIQKLTALAAELGSLPKGRQALWIPGGLIGRRLDGTEFPAEGTLARFQVRRETRYTSILRNVNDRLESERRITSLTSESEYLKEELKEIHNFHEIVGTGQRIRGLFDDISRVAGTNTTVLINGETGSGKELVARAIHAASQRAKKPLIKVNCAAIPALLMESEFFGHEKGAFTGATISRVGRFALADGGTIFLDEIGELPIELQAKLLRVLQEGEFEPVGSSKTRHVNVRVIAATNRDLQAAVGERKFRADLYYRLNVFPLDIPPLREHREDIELLSMLFMEQFSRQIGRPIQPLSPETLLRLQAYDWPGNVRELRNVIERAVISCRDGQLNLDAALPPAPVATPPPCQDAAHSDAVCTDAEIRQLERQNLIGALRRTNGRVAGPHGAAQLLGLNVNTLRSRLKALDIKLH